jgi:ABC-2 type transport system ATP-binding protein
MSTPYLDEAERCNRVALMNKGLIMSLGTPQKIKSSLNKVVVEIICSNIRTAYLLLKEKMNMEVQMFGDRINVIINNYDIQYPQIKDLLKKNSIEITSNRIITASLENVFIHLVKEAN